MADLFNPLPTTVVSGQTGHAALHNDTNTALNLLKTLPFKDVTGFNSATNALINSALAPILALIGDGADSDTVVNTVKDVLAVMANFPEGVNMLTRLSSIDANIINATNRSNHIGTQLSTTISDFSTAVKAVINATYLNAAFAAYLSANGYQPASGSSGGTTTPVTGPDNRTVIDLAKGVPTRPASLTNKGSVTILSNMQGQDGVIRLTGWYESLILNCGATPVVITNAVINHGVNRGIEGGENCNLTCNNVSFYGDPSIDGVTPHKHAIYLYHPTKVNITNTTVESSGGILIDHFNGDGTDPSKFILSGIKGRNIIGSGGQGGTGDLRSLIQLNTVLTRGDMSYIEYFGEPNKSRAEDVINLYNSGSPDTANRFTGKGFFIQGNFPYLAATNTQFTGAMFSIDGDGGSVGTRNTYFNKLWCISGGNAACNIAIGQHNTVDDIVALNSGYLLDGTPTQSSYAGIGVFDYYHTGSTLDNKILNAKVGWIRTKDTPASQRNRLDFSDSPDNATGAIISPYSYPGDITIAMERQAFNDWVSFLNTEGKTVGSQYTLPTS